MNSKSTWAFYKTLLKHPRRTGAAAPSSLRLARKIAAHVPLKKNALVVELGPGTGVITKALLEKGIPANCILAIEQSKLLSKQMRRKFQHVTVINDSAENLCNITALQAKPINTIVSSLPLLSLPETITKTILQQIESILEPGACYIQYTYGKKPHPFTKNKRFKKIYTKRIWLNLPPARIDVFQVKED